MLVPLEHICMYQTLIYIYPQGTEYGYRCVPCKRADKQTVNVLLIIVKLIKCKNEAWHDSVYIAIFVHFSA